MPKISTEEIIIATSAISLFPIIIPVLTPYLKYSIIFSLIKSGMNNQGVPSAMLVAVLSLLLAYNEMLPVISNVTKQYNSLSSELTLTEKIKVIQQPLSDWLKPQVPEKYQNNLIAGYIVSEIHEGLKIGLRIFAIFLVIDLIVAVSLACLGLQMLSPQGLSFAIKILLIIQSEFFAKIISTLSNGRIF